jgi:hypothetical protein
MNENTTYTPEELEAAAQARKKYLREKAREYRQKHPDRVKAALDRYWVKKGAELKKGE